MCNATVSDSFSNPEKKKYDSSGKIESQLSVLKEIFCLMCGTAVTSEHW